MRNSWRSVGIIVILGGILSLGLIPVISVIAAPINPQEMDPELGTQILDATIQIVMLASGPASEDQARRGTVTASRGLGNLIQVDGKNFIITHDHWKILDRLGKVEFYDADYEFLAAFDAETFQSFILYRDGGTMILSVPPGLEVKDRLEGKKLRPAMIGSMQEVSPGDAVVSVHRDAWGEKLEIVIMTVERFDTLDGNRILVLRSESGQVFVTGDSGAGVWHASGLVANQWARQMAWDLRAILTGRLGAVPTDQTLAATLPVEVTDLLASSFWEGLANNTLEDPSELLIP